MYFKETFLLCVIAISFHGYVQSCLTDTDCKNMSMCYDNVCECLTGFEGADCSVMVSMVPSNPCQHGGSCKEGITPCQCECTDEYTGYRCEKQNQCYYDQCNGGGCISKDTIHECICPAGYSGYNCQNYDACRDAPCTNGGTCQQYGNTGYTCTCPLGYSGISCEIVDPCYPSLCNGYTCIPDNIQDSYTCDCPFGYLKPNCAVFNICAFLSTNPCQNGGTCQSDNNGFWCLCPSGYIGSDCATFDPCASIPCQNGGWCTISGSSFTCTCLYGYSGSMCQTEETEACSFESTTKPLCDVIAQVIGMDEFDWSQMSGTTPTAGTGPAGAYDGLYYMYIEANGRKSGDTAVLVSPNLRGTSWCLKFYYSMYGADIDRLSVLTQRSVNQLTPTEVWYKQGDLGNKNWYLAKVDLTDTTDFQFFIKGVRGSRFKSDIAIDNLTLSHGACV